MGFLIYFSGVGAGVLLVPIITFFFGLPVSVAVGTASAYSTFTKIMAGIEHIRRGNVDFSLFKRLMLSTLPGVLLAAGAVNIIIYYYPDITNSLQSTMEIVIILTIFVALLLTVFKIGKTTKKISGMAEFVMGFFIGSIMGLTGVGGGVLLIPALFIMGNHDTKKVIGTSVIIALCLSGLTALIYAGGGQIHWELTIWMSLGSLLGIPIASQLLKRVPNHIVFYCVIVFNIIFIIVNDIETI